MTTSAKQVRTRFAPSPTGFVHIGSLRTALFSFLFARHNDGVNILRVEDTDQNRKVEGSLENLLGVMQDLQITFDEGFYLDAKGKVQERGDKGPYLQSQRLALYEEHALQLVKQNNAYYCFCDETRLDELRKEQVALKKPPMYDRHCRALAAEQVEQQLAEFSAAGKRPVIRQAIPEDGQTVVPDLVYGDMTFDHKVLDDQVLLKSDGFPTYHLAVVVDDHYMEVTHVIRGDEWIASTPKHLLLYKAFDWPPTAFSHLPLILNPDKSKLSKRQGDVSVEDFLRKGYLREALLNFVALLGWNPKTEQEFFSLDELIVQFDLSKVNKSGAVFDINKLDWINGHYIRHLQVGDLARKLVPFWQEAGLLHEQNKQLIAQDGTIVTLEYLEAVAKLEQERLKKLSEIGERTKYFFATPDYNPELLVWRKSTPEQTREVLMHLVSFLQTLDDSAFMPTELEQHLKSFVADRGYDNGTVLWPLRVALTGLDKSPGPFEVAGALVLGYGGKGEVVKRVLAAYSKF